MELITDGMVERELLLPENSLGPGAGRDITYSLSPELGIVLAARCRPACIVVTGTAGTSLRAPRLFALGDQGEPVRAIVVEDPVALPADVAVNMPHLPKLGPLGWFYRYMLLSRDAAAESLAEWAIAPPSRIEDQDSARVVCVYRHPDRTDSVGFRLSAHGDGTKARLDPAIGDLPQNEYYIEDLRKVMLNLISAEPR